MATPSNFTIRLTPRKAASCAPRPPSRVYRRKEGDRKGRMAWRPLRRGIADLHRRAEISHKAAARYLDAFATVDDTTTLDELLQRLETTPTMARPPGTCPPSLSR